MESDTLNLVFAYVLDGKGGAKRIDWKEIRAWNPESETIWVHLDRAGTESQRWLEDESGVSRVVCEALLAGASRPRSLRYDAGLLLNCRGVNLTGNKDEKLEDMVSLKIWAEPGRIITARHREVKALKDVENILKDDHVNGPHDIGDLVVCILDKLLDKMGPKIDELLDAIDGIEIGVSNAENLQRGSKASLSGLRVRAIGLRRYLAPQREVFSRLPIEEFPLFDMDHRVQLREISDRATRMVEDLDAARERASIVQDDITQLLSERQERATLVLTVVAAIFLPLGLLTGLWGVNAGGVPFSSEEQWWGFWVVVAVLLAMTLAALWGFRRMRLL